MKVLAISGGGANSGKTSLVLALIGVLPEWGILKTSPLENPDRDHGYGWDYELVLDHARLASAMKDTASFIAAGAARVAWLIARPPLPVKALVEVEAAFAGCPGLVIEGGALAEPFSPERRYVVVRGATTPLKAEAIERARRADAVLLNGPGSPAVTAALSGGARVMTIDALRADDPGTRAFLDEVSAWARR